MGNYNNYGQDQYGAENGMLTKAVGALNPWAAVAQFVVGRMAEPRAGAIDQGQANQNTITGGQDINAQHSSPFGYADSQGAQMMPGAEKMLPVNWKPLAVAPGQSVQGQTTINSTDSPYASSSSPWANIFSQYGRY